MAEYTPGSFLTNDECFDLFIDFIESDEWLLPIESFIDYFSVMFPTSSYNEHFKEKNMIFGEYKSIVKTNLESFLTEILNYSTDQLFGMLERYERYLDFEDMVYILACEDYIMFHDFMFDAALRGTKGFKRYKV